MRTIKTLQQISPAEIALAGQKVVDLVRLRAQHFNTPIAFCVLSNAFSDFLDHNGLRSNLSGVLSSLPPGGWDEAYSRIRDLFLASRLTEESESELLEAVDSLAMDEGASLYELMSEDHEPNLAMMLSPEHAVIPDLNEGIIQNIRGKEEIIRAIKECWACAFTSTMLKQRANPREIPFLSVLVSRMQQVAATAITWSHHHNDQSRIGVHVYEGHPDLQEKVSGDSFSVNKEYLSIEQSSIGQQDLKLVVSEHHFERVTLGAHGGQQKLNDKQVIEAARLTKRAQQILGCDVKLWLLFKEEPTLFQIQRLLVPQREEGLPVEQERIESATTAAGATVAAARDGSSEQSRDAATPADTIQPTDDEMWPETPTSEPVPDEPPEPGTAETAAARGPADELPPAFEDHDELVAPPAPDEETMRQVAQSLAEEETDEHDAIIGVQAPPERDEAPIEQQPEHAAADEAAEHSVEHPDAYEGGEAQGREEQPAQEPGEEDDDAHHEDAHKEDDESEGDDADTSEDEAAPDAGEEDDESEDEPDEESDDEADGEDPEDDDEDADEEDPEDDEAAEDDAEENDEPEDEPDEDADEDEAAEDEADEEDPEDDDEAGEDDESEDEPDEESDDEADGEDPEEDDEDADEDEADEDDESEDETDEDTDETDDEESDDEAAEEDPDDAQQEDDATDEQDVEDTISEIDEEKPAQEEAHSEPEDEFILSGRPEQKAEPPTSAQASLTQLFGAVETTLRRQYQHTLLRPPPDGFERALTELADRREIPQADGLRNACRLVTRIKQGGHASEQESLQAMRSCSDYLASQG